MDPSKELRSQLKAQIKVYLKQFQTGKESTRIGLVALLSRLEIEKGKIEQYGHQLNQNESMASRRAQ